MALALSKAQIAPSHVDYINAHATSTILGDAAENRAISRLMLGEGSERRPEEVCVSATKGGTGHLLGAAGAVEAIWSVCAIKDVGLLFLLFTSCQTMKMLHEHPWLMLETECCSSNIELDRN